MPCLIELSPYCFSSHPRSAICPETSGPPHCRLCSPEHWQRHQQQQQHQLSLLTKSYLIPGHPQCRALHQLVPLMSSTQHPFPTLLQRIGEIDAQNLPHLMEPTSDTIWPDVEFGSVRLFRLHSGSAVLWGQGETWGGGQGQDRAALSNQGLSWRSGWGI